MVDLPDPESPVSHRQIGLLELLPGSGILVDIHRLPVDIRGPAQSEIDHPRADCLIAEPVHQNETAEAPASVVRFKRYWPVDGEIDDPDVVQPQGSRRQMRSGFDIELVLDRRNGRHSLAGVKIE